MANKEYLDSQGLEELKKYIDNQNNYLNTIINLLKSDAETPGSIQYMINEKINEIDIADLLKDESLNLYGGSATEVL